MKRFAVNIYLAVKRCLKTGLVQIYEKIRKVALYFSQRLLVNWQNSKLYLSFDFAINTVLINERLLLKQEALGNNCFRYFRDF